MCLVAQSYANLCDPMDCSWPGSLIYAILQARIPEWVAISFSRGSSWPWDWTWVSCIAGRFFTIWTTREARINDLPQFTMINYLLKVERPRPRLCIVFPSYFKESSTRNDSNILPFKEHESSKCFNITWSTKKYITKFNISIVGHGLRHLLQCK